MLKVLSVLLFVTVLLPIWAVRRLFGTSRFERRFHQRASTWDRPVQTAPAKNTAP